MNMDANLDELSHDADLISRLQQFHETVQQIEYIVNLAKDSTIYDKLSNSEKVKYDLVMSYSLNSMFWMFLRAEGTDPTKHLIKLENERLKKAMLRAKQIEDRNTIMPRLNKDVAKRFVRNSLWEPKSNENKG